MMKWLRLSLIALGLVLVAGAASAQQQPVVVSPSPNQSAALVPVISASAEASHVLKASPGNLYQVHATNLTSTAGFLLVFNSATVPGTGSVTPQDCIALPGNGTAVINFQPGPAAFYSVGISVAATSASTCFTLTTGTITAFFSGNVD